MRRGSRQRCRFLDPPLVPQPRCRLCDAGLDDLVQALPAIATALVRGDSGRSATSLKAGYAARPNAAR
ncbi:hypothetical protein AAKU55_004280 [Oxalobacteraceae bacterium GrIS 1.11]